MARWRVLGDRCSTARQAVDFLQPLALNFGGMSLLLADAEQNLALLEKTTQGQCVRWLDAPGPPLCHTNHACFGPLSDPPGFLDSPLGKNSLARLDAMRRGVPGVPQSRQGLQAFFASHGHPGAVCQHGQGGLHTDYAVVLSPSAGGMWLSMGPPCKAPFTFVPVGNA